MKHFIFSFLFAIVAISTYAQPNFNQFRPQVDITKYEVVDSLPIENILIHFNKEVDDERLIYMGEGDYMAPVPHKDNMVIRTTNDRSKAIITHNSYVFGRHFEFNIEENERRIVLWFNDDNIYCGYIYDKQYKICKYFESKKEFKRFIRRPFFRIFNKQ